jgi:ABC-type lipopolysaccharide export system ATPase subunit
MEEINVNNLQNNVLSPAENAWDAWEMLTLEPLHANDPRYLDCSAARGIDVVQKLQIELRLHSRANKCMHQLFTGYRGDGKTTELYRFIGLIENDYRPLYFNAEEVFDLNDFRFTDFLLGIATVVFERMNEQKLKLPNDLLEKVANWFAKIVEIVERTTSAELKAEAGIGIPDWFKFVTAKLVGTIKTGGEKRKEVRTELNLCYH